MDKHRIISRKLDPDNMPSWLLGFFKKGYLKNNVIAGINEDDCAILKVGREELVITSDYLNANPIAIEFKLGSFWDLGRLLVASNISDLCGTGALPVAFLTSLMFDKNKTDEADFKLLMKGIKFELRKYKIPLVGGDTKLGNSNSFCGIALGIKEKSTKLFLKNAAVVGDSIWVSGNLGGVSAAIDGLTTAKISASWNKWAKDKIINPKLPYSKSRELAKMKIVNGGTDISDGLGADLLSLCRASRVGAIVDVSKIPYDKQVKQISKQKKIEPWYYSFTIGGDFQFLFTSKGANDDVLFKLGYKKIGEIIKSKQSYIVVDNQKYSMPQIGHRDINRDSFSGEVNGLIENLKSINHDNKKRRN